ncbi:hypothetical protein BDV98DRAFT_579162 [Pterulicium gracile]|uniref:REJ domain-containing protein n=1 Tax=Pterulicium gracile TaxID=1884261 RepID=A0A5C3R2H5_9AGAR|nr:hypothetical protein BDV98DRAFT_579162 [Pterula gracilis]
MRFNLALSFFCLVFAGLVNASPIPHPIRRSSEPSPESILFSSDPSSPFPSSLSSRTAVESPSSSSSPIVTPTPSTSYSPTSTSASSTTTRRKPILDGPVFW